MPILVHTTLPALELTLVKCLSILIALSQMDVGLLVIFDGYDELVFEATMIAVWFDIFLINLVDLLR